MLAVVIVTGCSSAPDPSEDTTEILSQANEYLSTGSEYFARGENVVALQFYELALQSYLSIDDVTSAAVAYSSIGAVLSATGRIDEARQSLDEAYGLASALGEQALSAQVNINRGELELRAGDVELARSFLEAALLEEAGLADGDRALLFHNLGAVYARDNDATRASTLIARALELNENEGRWSEAASNYYMLASLASRAGDHDRAYELAQTALEYDKRAENSIGIAIDLEALAAIEEHRGNLESSYQYLVRAVRVYVARNQPRPALRVLSELERVANLLGRDREAEQFATERLTIEELLLEHVGD